MLRLRKERKILLRKEPPGVQQGCNCFLKIVQVVNSDKFGHFLAICAELCNKNVFLNWEVATTLYGTGNAGPDNTLRLGRSHLIKRILLSGTIFILSLTGINNGAAQDNSHFDFTMEWYLPSWLESENESETNVKAPEPPLIIESANDPNSAKLPEYRRKNEPSFDIPIVVNDRVKQFIGYFQTKIRHKFSTWLSRSEKYIPFMRNILKEHGLPQDLVYMSLIESGFDPHAYSRAKAVGLWQFISPTGKRYGLRQNWWIDERRDPEKSTIAAARYLGDLYGMFTCWHLAAAGYNAGENKIIKAIKRYRTDDFWKLTNQKFLKQETKDYVPLMMAAALVAKDPEQYGFTDVEYEAPLKYEKVKVPSLTGLSHVAKACETSLEEIKDLNPELRREVTPPNENGYEVKIPFGKSDLFQDNFEAMRPNEKSPFKTHLVKKGETLKGIAKAYRVDLEPLLEINRLTKTSRLSKGMTLLIPVAASEGNSIVAAAQVKNGKARAARP
jgi:membrane-bound lytic murein transglycosylase D